MNRVSVTRRSTCPGGLSDNPTRVTFLSWARRQFEIGLLQVLFEPSAEVCLYVSPRVRMLALSFATANRIFCKVCRRKCTRTRRTVVQSDVLLLATRFPCERSNCPSRRLRPWSLSCAQHPSSVEAFHECGCIIISMPPAGNHPEYGHGISAGPCQLA